MKRWNAGRGFEWFTKAVDLGGRNPRTLFLAALVFLLISAVPSLLDLPRTIQVMQTGQPVPPSPWTIALILAFALLSFPLAGGFLHVIREIEAGRPVGVGGLFEAFRNGCALPLLAALLLGAVAAIAVMTPVFVLAGAMLSGGGERPGLGPALLLFALIALALFAVYALFFFAIPRIMFDRVGPLRALIDSFRASFANVLPLLLCLVIYIAAAVAALLVIALVAVLLFFVGKAIGTAVGVALAAIAYLCGIALLNIVTYGIMFVAWRDVFGDAPPPAGQDQIVAA